MAKHFDKKIIWTIKNFSSLPSDVICSDSFIVGGCKWNLRAYPKGSHDSTHFSLYLGVANLKSLPCGWRRHAKYRLTIVNQSSDKLSHSKDFGDWFDEMSPSRGYNLMFSLNEIHGKDSGFLLNGELKTIVEIKVLEVIGKSDVTEETSTTTIREEVHGFILHPSQANFVSRMFEKHPEIASDFRPKSPNLRSPYMMLLISQIRNTFQLTQQMSEEDLNDAYAALGSLKNVGFKLDWLEKKLDEVSEKMEDKKTIEAELQEVEEELKDLKHKCSDMEDLVQIKKAKLSALKDSITFDEFFFENVLLMSSYKI